MAQESQTKENISQIVHAVEAIFGRLSNAFAENEAKAIANKNEFIAGAKKHFASTGLPSSLIRFLAEKLVEKELIPDKPLRQQVRIFKSHLLPVGPVLSQDARSCVVVSMFDGFDFLDNMSCVGRLSLGADRFDDMMDSQGLRAVVIGETVDITFWMNPTVLTANLSEEIFRSEMASGRLTAIDLMREFMRLSVVQRYYDERGRRGTLGEWFVHVQNLILKIWPKRKKMMEFILSCLMELRPENQKLDADTPMHLDDVIKLFMLLTELFMRNSDSAVRGPVMYQMQTIHRIVTRFAEACEARRDVVAAPDEFRPRTETMQILTVNARQEVAEEKTLVEGLAAIGIEATSSTGRRQSTPQQEVIAHLVAVQSALRDGVVSPNDPALLRFSRDLNERRASLSISTGHVNGGAGGNSGQPLGGGVFAGNDAVFNQTGTRPVQTGLGNMHFATGMPQNPPVAGRAMADRWEALMQEFGF